MMSSTRAASSLTGGGLRQNPTTKTRLERRLGHDIDLDIEQIGQIHQQATEIEQASIRFKIDQKIHVARRIRITPDDGSEDANVARPTASGHGGDGRCRTTQGLQGHRAR